MKKLMYIIVILLAVFTFSFFIMKGKNKTHENPNINLKSANNMNSVVVLELFTSQGCSSCPPADKVLGNIAMAKNENIIPLAFHVDYWDRLGWKDPFSKAEFTNRQRTYGNYFNLSSIYTPQIIVNGRDELVGSYSDRVQTAIEKAFQTPQRVSIEINQATEKLDFEYKATGNLQNVIYHTAWVQKKGFTHIERGENRNLDLDNFQIVKDFKSYKEAQNTFSFVLPNNEKKDNYMLVVYAQDTETGHIVGGSKHELR